MPASVGACLTCSSRPPWSATLPLPQPERRARGGFGAGGEDDADREPRAGQHAEGGARDAVAREERQHRRDELEQGGEDDEDEPDLILLAGGHPAELQPRQRERAGGEPEHAESGRRPDRPQHDPRRRDQAVGEVQRLLGDVEGAVVKRSLGFHSAATMTPQAGQALIRDKARAAVQRLRSFKPHQVRGPFALDLTFKNYTPAEAMTLLPGVERRTAHAIRYQAKSMLDVVRFIQFATTYRSDLTP